MSAECLPNAEHVTHQLQSFMSQNTLIGQNTEIGFPSHKDPSPPQLAWVTLSPPLKKERVGRTHRGFTKKDVRQAGVWHPSPKTHTNRTPGMCVHRERRQHFTQKPLFCIYADTKGTERPEAQQGDHAAAQLFSGSEWTEHFFQS